MRNLKLVQAKRYTWPNSADQPPAKRDPDNGLSHSLLELPPPNDQQLMANLFGPLQWHGAYNVSRERAAGVLDSLN